MDHNEKTMDKIVAFCKNRGFVYAGSEIYGGLANSWDYGPLGVEFKNNVKKAWLKKFVQESPYNVGLDAAIIMNPQTWVTTGHVSSFSDPLLDCKSCRARHRADKLIGEEHHEVNVDAMTFEEMDFDSVFDGIWACASLLHVPEKELSDILTKIARALKDSGILYMSFKLGDFEGFRGERYFCDYTEDAMEEVLKDNDRFDVVKIWETEDVRSGHSDTRWLNVLVRKQ